MVFKFYCKVVVIALFSWVKITILESSFNYTGTHSIHSGWVCYVPKLHLISVTLKYIRYSQTLAKQPSNLGL